MLTERENMEICWNHEQPEWVPMINTAAQMIISPEINDRPLFMSGKDDFGLEWEVDPNHPELMSHVKPGSIFTDISDWEDFIKFPSCKDKNWEAAAMRTKAMWQKKDILQGYFVGNIGAFERICSMMGHTNALTAPYEDPEAYQAYIDSYTEYRLEQFEFIKKYYDVDFLMMHDDWGNQNGMFMSPEMWRQFYKESERRLAARAHELGMKYMHHSCGYITPIVGDLVEIGVDSWHAVQPMNDLKMLKETYGDKLIFAGCVDAQVTDVPGVTEDVVRAEVRRVIDTLGKGGGLMVSSSVMFSIIPKVDGIIDDEGKKYGQYSTLKFA